MNRLYSSRKLVPPTLRVLNQTRQTCQARSARSARPVPILDSFSQHFINPTKDPVLTLAYAILPILLAQLYAFQFPYIVHTRIIKFNFLATINNLTRHTCEKIIQELKKYTKVQKSSHTHRKRIYKYNSLYSLLSIATQTYQPPHPNPTALYQPNGPLHRLFF